MENHRKTHNSLQPKPSQAKKARLSMDGIGKRPSSMAKAKTVVTKPSTAKTLQPTRKQPTTTQPSVQVFPTASVAPATTAATTPTEASPFSGLGSRLHDLSQKPMTRKQFLVTSAFAIASVIGLGGLLRLLSGNNNHGFASKVHDGYGDLTYGGIKPKTASNTTALTSKGRI